MPEFAAIEKSTDAKQRVVVFGIFDGVHDGHRDFFRQASEFGEHLIVVVGRDGPAFRLKGRKPRHSESKRLDLVAHEQWVSFAVLGDEELSSYQVLEELNPDVICLGYDQQELGEDLRRWMKRRGNEIPTHHLKPHAPDRLHSSLL